MSRRVRRSSDHVRGLMLDAARELFAEKGLAGTRTRDIAQRAGVSEQLLFNHFGSKDELFAAAVLNPFDDFVATYVERWSSVSAATADPREMVREYVADLYRLVVENRALFAALGAARFGVAARPMLERLEALTAEVETQRGLDFDAAIAVRLFFVAVTTIALHQDELLPGKPTDLIVDEIAATLANGLTLPR